MPKDGKNRQLTEEETLLWQKVIAQVKEIAPRVEIMAAQPVKTDKKLKSDFPTAIKHFRVGQKNTTRKTNTQSNPSTSFTAHTQQVSPNMDRRNFQRLLKGKLEIDGTLDLHGLTADQARVQLVGFVQRANRTDHRLLLIITGKGENSGFDEFNRPRIGVIKQGVPEWLKSGHLSGMILQITQAHIRHGGAGAYYVYLRRRR